jgi:hypothetical protein
MLAIKEKRFIIACIRRQIVLGLMLQAFNSLVFSICYSLSPFHSRRRRVENSIEGAFQTWRITKL